MEPHTKTYIALGLAVLAVFEFWTAMRIFGRKTEAGERTRLLLRLHRIGGYVFLVLFVGLMWVGVNMLTRLGSAGGYVLDARKFYHVFLAMSLFATLLLKISFVRFHRKYRGYVPLLGIILSAGTLVLWGIAGLMFLALMGGVKPGA